MPAENQISQTSSMLRSIARGPLWEELESSAHTSPLLDVTLPQLGPAFIAKGKIGRHHKSISRNGLILMMSTVPLPNLAGTGARIRLSIWHRSHLPGERAQAYGLLLHVEARQAPSRTSHTNPHTAEIGASHDADALLSFELGGGRFLNFFAAPRNDARR
jgi:hypothetical protein